MEDESPCAEGLSSRRRSVSSRISRFIREYLTPKVWCLGPGTHAPLAFISPHPILTLRQNATGHNAVSARAQCSVLSEFKWLHSIGYSVTDNWMRNGTDPRMHASKKYSRHVAPHRPSDIICPLPSAKENHQSSFQKISIPADSEEANWYRKFLGAYLSQT